MTIDDFFHPRRFAPGTNFYKTGQKLTLTDLGAGQYCLLDQSYVRMSDIHTFNVGTPRKLTKEEISNFGDLMCSDGRPASAPRVLRTGSILRWGNDRKEYLLARTAPNALRLIEIAIGRYATPEFLSQFDHILESELGAFKIPRHAEIVKLNE